MNKPVEPVEAVSTAPDEFAGWTQEAKDLVSAPLPQQMMRVTVVTSDAHVVEGVFSDYRQALTWARNHRMSEANLREGVLDQCLYPEKAKQSEASNE